MFSSYKDYKEILEHRLSKKFNQLPPKALDKISPKNFLTRIAKSLKYSIKDWFLPFFQLRREEQLSKYQNMNWLFVVSSNNYRALKFLENGLNDSVFVANHDKCVGSLKNAEVTAMRSNRRFVFSFLAIPAILILAIVKLKFAIRFFDQIIESVGYLEYYKHLLKQAKPKSIIFSNDHNLESKALLLAARKNGIQTIYIQHASVSEFFPPLRFDLSLLDGLDSKEKYEKIGNIEGEVKLIGIPKYDEYLSPDSSKNENRDLNGDIKLGLCTNIMDEEEEIFNLIEELFESNDHFEIYFRPHPGDRRKFEKLKKIPKVFISNSVDQNAIDFVRGMHVLIAGNSSIHLEAACFQTPSVYFSMDKGNFIHDYYGYLTQGLIKSAPDSKELIKMIPKVQEESYYEVDKVRYYNAVFGTIHFGKSEELAISEISKFLNEDN